MKKTKTTKKPLTRGIQGKKPSLEALQKTADVMESENMPKQAIAAVQTQEIDSQRIIAAERAMAMSFDRHRQIELIQKDLGIPKPEAHKIHRILRQLYALEAHVDRDTLRHELRRKAYAVWDAAQDELSHHDPKNRSTARGHMMKLLQFLAELDGLKIPTKHQVEFSQTRHNHYADVIQAEAKEKKVQEAKEALLSSGLIDEAHGIAKRKMGK